MLKQQEPVNEASRQTGVDDEGEYNRTLFQELRQVRKLQAAAQVERNALGDAP